MRAETEKKLNQSWYGGGKSFAGLNLLVPVYRLANRLDHWFKTRRQPADHFHTAVRQPFSQPDIAAYVALC